ncbi:MULTISPECIES: PspC domain-containing protein [Paenibacillus]|uniref:Phage shock protein C, PspC n=1 Tax=Paenibacillus lactis 154 TaxID=743719 RepID=G4HLB4_9BACL|nr:PspC domain-containing protein [Paenibacillus lactis]EHB56840.1 phage shock protein C, PspC [Paenibacillus lactis 154]MCM3493385.1 PspC domain-containing protein [Paenibacillus lactis]
MTRLYRSTRDKMFTGLIGGLSDYFGVESTILRIIFVVSIFFTGGTTLLIYLIATLVVSKEPPYYHDPYAPHGRHGGHGGYRFNDAPGPGYNGYNDNYGRPGYPNEGGFGPKYDRSGRPDPGYGPRNNASADSGLDAMMQDIEKKALQKEIEELKKKLSDYEKGDK